MNDLLYLAHRIPFPPDKGDKIRSFHILESLARRYRVHLGTFLDDPADARYVDELRRYCASLEVVPLRPFAASLRSVSGLLRAQPLTFSYYGDRRLHRWVSRLLATVAPRIGLAFSSPMEQYLPAPGKGMRRLIDLVDVDSDKWRQYSKRARGPMRWIYAREARLLAKAEHVIVRNADASVVVSTIERETLIGTDAGLGRKLFAIPNGVDGAYFDPAPVHVNPYRGDELPIVFTGAMDYWANVDAVTWFVREVLPAVRRERTQVRFYIVGSNPTRAVLDLGADAGVQVTGRVADVRPYLAHAALVVAPLRLARGVQNKVLEAMAMAKAVVVTRAALRGIAAQAPPGVVVRDDPDAFADAVKQLLASGERQRMGAEARRFVLREFSWSRAMDALCALIEGDQGAAEA